MKNANIHRRFQLRYCYIFSISSEMPQSQTIHVECHSGCVTIAADSTTSGYIGTQVQRELSGKHLPMFVRLWPVVLHIVVDATTHASRMLQKNRSTRAIIASRQIVQRNTFSIATRNIRNDFVKICQNI